MTRLKIIFIILSICTINKLEAQNCGSCISLPVESIQFANGVGTPVNPGGTLTIPYNANNTSKTIRVDVSPHTTNSLNTGQWATNIEISLNGSSTIPGISGSNPYSHNSGGNSSGRLIPFSDLHVGTNTLCVKAKCNNSGSQCTLACFTIIVDPPPPPPSGAITLAMECCTAYTNEGNPPRPVSHFTGNVKFKMSGTLVNAWIKVVSQGNTYYEGFINGGYTQCYRVPVVFSIVDATVTHAAVTGATVNGKAVYNISKFIIPCEESKLQSTIKGSLVH